MKKAILVLAVLAFGFTIGCGARKSTVTPPKKAPPVKVVEASSAIVVIAENGDLWLIDLGDEASNGYCAECPKVKQRQEKIVEHCQCCDPCEDQCDQCKKARLDACRCESCCQCAETAQCGCNR